MGVQATDPLAQLSLPPGFRFYPTDEELMVQYLCPKVAGHHFSLQIIGEIDLYKFDPWDLPSKAIFGEKEWYFFSPRDRKYPNGSRPNRVAGSGYWKATGTDKVITTEGRKVGIKKALVFYVGKAPKGTKTNWIMHEYRLSDTTRKSGSLKLDEWVLCRIYKKNSRGQKPELSDPRKEVSHGGSSSSSSSQFDDMLESLPEINDQLFNLPRMNSLKALHKENKLNIQSLTSGNFDWASIAGAATLPELIHPPVHQLNNNSNNNLNMNLINDGYTPSVEEEVQSGLRKQRVLNAGYFQQNLTGLSRSNDPFGIRYPTQTEGPGFGYGFHQ